MLAADWDVGFALEETGVVPQRPRTQPPTRLLRVEDDFRGVWFAVEVSVVALSSDTTDKASECELLLAATDARSEREDRLEVEGRGPISAVTLVVDMMGGVESSSVAGETIRRGARSGGSKLDCQCQLPSREFRSTGVWMSIPATERRLSWELAFLIERDGILSR